MNSGFKVRLDLDLKQPAADAMGLPESVKHRLALISKASGPDGGVRQHHQTVAAQIGDLDMF